MSLRKQILHDSSQIEKIDFEVLLLAGLMIERVRKGAIGDEGVEQEFQEDPPTEEDIVLLKENIVKFIYSTPPTLLLQQAIGTLGKTGDKDIVAFIKPFLHRYLRQLLEINTVIYSAMVALDHCGEPVFSRDQFGLAEFDHNISDARNYLKEQYQVNLA